jgi:hypothetical protein
VLAEPKALLSALCPKAVCHCSHVTSLGDKVVVTGEADTTESTAQRQAATYMADMMYDRCIYVIQGARARGEMDV